MLFEWDKNKTEEELFAENEYLIRCVICKIPRESAIDSDDLYQEGAMALLTVIRKIKEEGLDVKTTSYIEKSIRKRVRRYIQYQGTTLHVSRRMQSAEIENGKEAIDDVISKATAIPIYDCMESSFASKVSSVEGDALLNCQIEEIIRTVDRLPNKKKKIMREYFNSDMNIEETAKRCGCSTRTVYRARAFLREKIRYLKILEKDMSDGEKTKE